MTHAHTPVRVEASRKRVRAYLGGVAVVDTLHPLLVWEHPHYPAYYLPAADFTDGALEATGESAHSPSRGDAGRYTVRAGNAVAAGAALRYDESPVPELNGHVRLEWEAMDAWFEEDEEVFTHPRNPYARIDILPSSRQVRVALDGVTIAETTSARMLFETHLPVRYYLPKTDVRMDLLERSATSTGCPYKGTAEYWSVRVGDALHDDVAWSYRTPLPESQKIAGLIAFWKDVEIFVDGVRQEG
jgi:uncharacterized protein (DUF427 family)